MVINDLYGFLIDNNRVQKFEITPARAGVESCQVTAYGTVFLSKRNDRSDISKGREIVERSASGTWRTLLSTERDWNLVWVQETTKLFVYDQGSMALVDRGNTPQLQLIALSDTAVLALGLYKHKPISCGSDLCLTSEFNVTRLTGEGNLIWTKSATKPIATHYTFYTVATTDRVALIYTYYQDSWRLGIQELRFTDGESLNDSKIRGNCAKRI